MFNSSKYTNWYFSLIEKAKLRSDIKGELHHIVPRCLGGSDDPDNLVMLTYREHYIAHILLTKMNDSPKLLNAVWQMSNKNKSKYHNSHMYNMVKAKFVESISGDNHWMKQQQLKDKISNSWTDERKISHRKSTSGDNHWTFSKDRSAHAAMMRANFSPEARRENGLKGVFVTNNPMKRPEIAALFRKPKPAITCPHCGKTGGKPVMMRYHFDKCKHIAEINNMACLTEIMGTLKFK
jgi:hypothetical protein